MRRRALILLLTSCAAWAQMSPDQKAADFTQLAANFAKNYGPVQWKREQFRFDLLDISAWVKRAAATEDDLDFYDVCLEYVAGLRDAHSGFYLPSDFQATLPLRVDLYDGRVLVDALSQLLDGQDNFPVGIGDELIAIDDQPVAKLIDSFAKYAVTGNDLSTRRLAAAYLVSRPQMLLPRAHEIGKTAVLMVKHPDGRIDSVEVAWSKSGSPLTLIGPVLSPRAVSARPDPLARLRQMSIPEFKFVQGFGRIQPAFYLPSAFKTRAGRSRFDSVYSGTWEAGGRRLGYLRIPRFDSVAVAVQFKDELAYMRENTDALVLDIMRNPGGDGCLAQQMLQQVIPYPFHNIGLEIRATRNWLVDFEDALARAFADGEPEDVVRQYQNIVNELERAYLTPSGRTAPLPVCGPTLEIDPAENAYDKPILLLTDEFSASAADLFAAVFQDAQRGPIFGSRTMGAGGNVETYDHVTTYSDGMATITESLMVRKSGKYVENLGVEPDIRQDFMTGDNLLNGGAPFVEAFTKALLERIK